MKNLLVSSQDLIKEKVYFGYVGDSLVCSVDISEVIDSGVKKEEVKELNLAFHYPSFKYETLYLSEVFNLNRERNVVGIDPVSLRFCRLKILLKEWDLEIDGKPIELNRENIDNLNNDLGEAMIKALERNL